MTRSSKKGFYNPSFEGKKSSETGVLKKYNHFVPYFFEKKNSLVGERKFGSTQQISSRGNGSYLAFIVYKTGFNVKPISKIARNDCGRLNSLWRIDLEESPATSADATVAASVVAYPCFSRGESCYYST